MSLDIMLRIGAALSSGFHGAIGAAMRSVRGVEAATQQLQSSWAGLAAGAGTLAGLGSTMSQAADVESLFNDIRITADLTRGSIAEMGNELEALTVPSETNRSVTELGNALNVLVTGGMDYDDAKASVRSVGRTATATGAEVEALSRTAGALIDNLNISPEGLERSFDQLAVAGKQGKFELKDMAQYFPVLGAQAKAAGLQGTEAVVSLGAALQIAMKGAGSQGEAANNMNNFMAQLSSPTVRKAFAERGVDLSKLMSDAVANGENPMEVVLEKIDELLGSDPAKRGARMAALFGDMQVQNFLRPMLANMPEYYRIKAEAEAALGTVDEDYAKRMEEANQVMAGARNAANNLGNAVGGILAKAWAAVLKPITPVLNVLAQVVEQSPLTTSAILGIGSALVLLPPAFTLVKVAWAIMSAGMMATGVGAIIALVAIGAALIIDNWQAVSAFFQKYGRIILAFFGPIGWAGIALINNWEWVQEKAGKIWSAISAFFTENGRAILDYVGPVGWAAGWLIDNWSQLPEYFSSMWDRIGRIWDAAVGDILGKWELIATPVADLGNFLGFGDDDAPDAAPHPDPADSATPPATPPQDQPSQPEGPQTVSPRAPTMPRVGQAMPHPSGSDAAPPGMAAEEMMRASPQAAQAVAQVSRVDVLVRFANLPSGTSIQTRSSDDRVRVSASVGPAMAGIN